MITALIPRNVHKLWGRRDIPAAFGTVGEADEPVGEVWFERLDGADAELLVKYLFTSERLSIQVHPDDATARAAGYLRGKDEAWLILSAEPDARIGLGTHRMLSPEELRRSALDGSIVDLLDWQKVRPGEVIYSPAGTIHAIGGGLSLIEVQQNCDLTYRLYDYGRPRELHLDEAMAVARTGPFERSHSPTRSGAGSAVELEGPSFVLERWRDVGSAMVRPEPGRPLLLIMLAGEGRIGDTPLQPGGVVALEAPAALVLGSGGELLVAYSGGAAVEGLLSPA
jgi:mannose-6-phosphate isomerase